MTTQVRTFKHPQPLGETLAKDIPRASTPRSVPELPEFFKSKLQTKLGEPYKKFPMAPHNEGEAGGITFAHQDQLPKLPIPDLESTAERYLRALRPLQSPREYGETKHAIEDFVKNDGPELQEKLKAYAHGKTSYIEQFCRSCSSLI